MDKKELLKESKEQFVQCMDNDSDNRNLQMQDLKFSTLDQWPEDFRNKRESKGLPCLTIDKINQYIVQVVNDMRKNKPGVKVRPIDDKADIKTADINMGIIRHIEDISNAEVAYSIAAESQVRVGEGYYRFVTDYPDPMSRNQEIYIKPIFDRFSVRLGPHLMPDGSDMEYAYIFEDISLETFKCTWPKAKTKAVEIDSGDTGYFMGEKTIRVFERFYKEYESVDIVFLDNGQAMTKEEFDKLPVYLGAPIITSITRIYFNSFCFCFRPCAFESF